MNSFQNDHFFDQSKFFTFMSVGQWVAKVESFSSQYSDKWPATNVIGPSNTYPKYGDQQTAWAASKSTNSKEFLELSLPSKQNIIRMVYYFIFDCRRFQMETFVERIKAKRIGTKI
jgi:hypothetical protein